MTREEEIKEQSTKYMWNQRKSHFEGYDIERAFKAGAEWADQHPKDNIDINFPKYDNIVDKVFGAGNIECWEYDQAKQLVKLAKDELLLELKAQQSNLVDIDKACEWIKDNIKNYVWCRFDEICISENIVNDFKKTMKGE